MTRCHCLDHHGGMWSLFLGWLTLFSSFLRNFYMSVFFLSVVQTVLVIFNHLSNRNLCWSSHSAVICVSLQFSSLEESLAVVPLTLSLVLPKLGCCHAHARKGGGRTARVEGSERPTRPPMVHNGPRFKPLGLGVWQNLLKIFSHISTYIKESMRNSTILF